MDKSHPFISNPKLFIFYGISWIAIDLALIFIQWQLSQNNIEIAILDISAFFLTYPIIGLAIWFVIRYNTLENNTYTRLIGFHFIAASIITFFWIYIGIVIIKIITPLQYELYYKDKIPVKIFEGYVLYIFYVILFYAINYYHNYKETVKKESELKALVKEAELHALKSQINPHFLFNSLNSISSLTMSDPQKAQEMVINLSSLMRFSLKYGQNEIVSFNKELDNNKLYLHIEKVRFGKKLNPVFKIEDECLNAFIPNMILQPLYENAIKYGVYEATEPVDVVTTCILKNDFLIITIQNSYDPDVVSKKGEGIGLRNIRDRLKIIYGNADLIQIKNINGIFTVTLSIPQNKNYGRKNKDDNR